MIAELTAEKYLGSLLEGNRRQCRSVIEEYLHKGVPASRVYADILWKSMVEVDKMYRENLINNLQEHLATRINRAIVDQLQNKLPRKADKDKKIVIACAASEHGELGAQMAADLFESDGWDVRFLGGGVADDELFQYVGSFRPDVLMIFGSASKQAPKIKLLIDRIKDVNSCPEMKIMLSGGIFERADELWEEIGADIYAESAADAVLQANMPTEELYKPVRSPNRKRQKSQCLAIQEAELMAQ